MNAQKIINDLPACPVETTLTLIGDKWKVLIIRELLTGTKRFGELKKIHWQRIAKGIDGTASGNGRKRFTDTHRICRSTPASGIHLNRIGAKLKADTRRFIKLGRGIQKVPE